MSAEQLAAEEAAPDFSQLPIDVHLMILSHFDGVSLARYVYQCSSELRSHLEQYCGPLWSSLLLMVMEERLARCGPPPEPQAFAFIKPISPQPAPIPARIGDILQGRTAKEKFASAWTALEAKCSCCGRSSRSKQPINELDRRQTTLCTFLGLHGPRRC